MIPYQTKTSKLPGTSYGEVYTNAQSVFGEIKRRTKRRPYVRSAYFRKQKIFFDYFWDHLWRTGGYKERTKRLKYFEAAIEVLKRSRNKELFFVQVKEHKPTGRKYFMSCFPPE